MRNTYLPHLVYRRLKLSAQKEPSAGARFFDEAAKHEKGCYSGSVLLLY